jgi:hypothetical protein
MAALDVRVGQVYERVDHLLVDGTRMKFRSRHDHTRIRIVSVPDGKRKKVIRHVKVDPRRGGNGGRDRGEHTITLEGLARNYELVTADA